METLFHSPDQTTVQSSGVIHFPFGLAGLESVKNYLLRAKPADGPLLELETIEGAKHSIMVMPPGVVVSNYEPDINDQDAEFLGLRQATDAVVLNILTRQPDGATINLKEPLVINRHTLIGKQVVPNNAAEFPARHPVNDLPGPARLDPALGRENGFGNKHVQPEPNHSRSGPEAMNSPSLNSAGADYYEVLPRIHAFLKPRTYVEIGIRNGVSFALAKTATVAIGIDPAPNLTTALLPGARVFRMTSDDFFAQHNLAEQLGHQPVDLAFIDGMHTFEFVLRDFINLEKFCSRDSTILVHDCYPLDRVTAARERTTQVWSGDVWKLILCLKKYRPDLQIHTVDVAPTGLAIIRGCDPQSTVLASRRDSLNAEFIPYEYDKMAAAKAEQLNRIENTWQAIAAALPASGTARKVETRERSTGLRQPGAKAKPRALGVLLCYNDADILPDTIEWLLENNHDLIVWDHGSDDGTDGVLDRYAGHFVERKFIPREFDFYKLYGEMSENLRAHYIQRYDWISWPDQDEILEGPSRQKSYYDHITEVFESEFNWIRFRNFNYWFTEEDDPAISTPTQRIRRYCLFPDCSPRIRAWRASVTNLRAFNHNPLAGLQEPRLFNLRHYPMRTHQGMVKRLNKDRAGLERGGQNYHYENMKARTDKLLIPAKLLHFDDGRSELDAAPIFDWRSIYGHGMQAPVATGG